MPARQSAYDEDYPEIEDCETEMNPADKRQKCVNILKEDGSLTEESAEITEKINELLYK